MPQPKTIRPVPKSVREALEASIPSFSGEPKPPIQTFKRAEEISLKKADVKDYSIDFEDIDSAVLYYFKEVIKPYVIQDGSRVAVPIDFANQERWKTAQRDGGLRDKDGKILFPIVILKKDNVEKDRSISTKLDGNVARNYHIFEQKYTKTNAYDNFAALTNRVPVKQYGMVVVPDYCKITYSCAVYVNYQEDLNKILEGIMFASDSYWGDPKRFTFMTRVDGIPITQELNTGEDRKIYSTFNLTLNGHIIPDTINQYMATQKAYFSTAQVRFNTEVVGKTGSGREVTTVTNGGGDNAVFPERVVKSNNKVSEQTAFYLATMISKSPAPSGIISNKFTLVGARILTAPTILPVTSKSDFYVFINGQYINQTEVVSVNQVGDNVEVTLDTVGLGYELSSTDEIEIKGKFES